ncbi:hypothetical protein sscle_16g107480 [Sclerotinia sclerotiorum 1980 UF-70]|uniref:Uncharacterized protein n=1 Tax=Sclerotinia sclerotiorum (strain ATCC 18683 / 1980 / Ss-1) TaxID=665079 RepID=A0A1D9QM11_SCLS1|nr:hypothetical protein sscle_16g107480 [Sclerotinia sclerotiorum 1980 UF-70]
MSLLRGVRLNLIVLASFVLFVYFHQRAATMLPQIDCPSKLAEVQKPMAYPNSGSLKLECPHPTVEDVPLISGHDSSERKFMNDLREQGIVVLLRTGTQEVQQLAIHLGTMLRYFRERNIMFFSDSQSTIGPFTIHDTLKSVDQKIRETNTDFKIYRDIHRYQIAGQNITELKEEKGKGDGRWEIGMDDRQVQVHSYGERGVFYETSCKLWLKKLDFTKPLYLGAGLIHEETYLLMGAVGRGDVALAKALYKRGINLTGSHPFINGDKPSTLSYGPRQNWCQPAITMHHLMPQEICKVWRFERQRDLSRKSNAATFSELYSHFVCRATYHAVKRKLE